jgi:hypothetical protein
VAAVSTGMEKVTITIPLARFIINVMNAAAIPFKPDIKRIKTEPFGLLCVEL